jgi:integrase
MESYLTKLKENVSVNSYNQYARIYKLLGLKTGAELEDVALISAKIEDKSANTRKNYLASIVKLLRMMPDNETNKKLIDTYSKLMNVEIENTKPTNTYNEKQKANLMTMAEINQIRDSMLTGIKPADLTKRINYDTLLDHMILSLYTLQPPRRNEFYDMLLAKSPAEVDNTQNWILWTPKKKEFIFQRYKTAKTYGTERFPISKELDPVIKNYLKYRDSIALPDNKAFLVKYGNQNFENSNDITRRLNRMLGKNVGASMLRHIYLSEKYGATIKMMEKDAKALGHSVEQQKDYIKT